MERRNRRCAPADLTGEQAGQQGADQGADERFVALTRALGERVRRHRARRGMSRKVLSQLSGVSERYLAQLESGQANVSFNILWSLAQTMDTSIGRLLEDRQEEAPDLVLAKRLLESLNPEEQAAALNLLRLHFGQGREAKGRVALIGLRGAGKTTLGRMLAEHFQMPFIRITPLVEQTAGMDMTDILIAMGQKGYRRLERNALQSTIAQHPRAVIETGGSIVSEPATFELLLSSCFTVWIQATPEEHMSRVVEQGDTRPMEGHMQRAMDDLRTILAARSALYSRADATVNTSNRSREECARELIALCSRHLSQVARTLEDAPATA